MWRLISATVILTESYTASLWLPGWLLTKCGPHNFLDSNLCPLLTQAFQVNPCAAHMDTLAGCQNQKYFIDPWREVVGVTGVPGRAFEEKQDVYT